MPRFFLHLAYDGTPFHGWQIQPNASSVQQTIEEALKLLFQRKIDLTGCGRTDTGVHARNFYAHIDLTEKEALTAHKRIPFSINKILPPEISILRFIPVEATAHARFDATLRSYKYYIALKKQAIGSRYSSFFYGNLDLALMNAAAQKLKEYTDFTSFSKLHTQTFTNDCKIGLAEWNKEGDLLVFSITADRFLRNMVRAITGTLLSVGQQKIDIQKFCSIIEAKDRNQAGTSVPAQGLFLEEVTYPKQLFWQEA